MVGSRLTLTEDISSPCPAPTLLTDDDHNDDEGDDDDDDVDDDDDNDDDEPFYQPMEGNPKILAKYRILKFRIIIGTEIVFK